MHPWNVPRQHHVLQSKELEISNEGLLEELTLTDAEASKLQQQVVSVRVQTMYIRTLGDQLNQEMSMLQRVSFGLKLSMQGTGGGGGGVGIGPIH